MKFTTTFEGIEKNQQSTYLPLGIFDVKVFNSAVKEVGKNKTEQLSLGFTALESEGEHVGSVAYGSIWLYKKGEEDKGLSEHARSKIMEFMDAANIGYETEGEFTFDTDDFKEQILTVKVGVKNGYTKDDGTKVADSTEVKYFLTPEEAATQRHTMNSVQSPVAKALPLHETDILETIEDKAAVVEEEVKEEAKPAKKKVAKKPAKKKAVKKEAPVVEEEAITVEEAIAETPFDDPEEEVKTEAKVEETGEEEVDLDELLEDLG